MGKSDATTDVPVAESPREFTAIRQRARGVQPVVCARRRGDVWAAYYDFYTITYRLSDAGRDRMQSVLDSYARAADADARVTAEHKSGELTGVRRETAIEAAEAALEVAFNTRYWRVVELPVDRVPAESIPGGEHPSPSREAVESGEWRHE